jgi:hypothetical protein
MFIFYYVNFIVDIMNPYSKTSSKFRVTDPDPDSIGSVDPDPYTESGSGSSRAKITHKSRKKVKNFMF